MKPIDISIVCLDADDEMAEGEGILVAFTDAGRAWATSALGEEKDRHEIDYAAEVAHKAVKAGLVVILDGGDPLEDGDAPISDWLIPVAEALLELGWFNSAALAPEFTDGFMTALRDAVAKVEERTTVS
jgi:hypothetical protein